jgi:hypothetical protein
VTEGGASQEEWSVGMIANPVQEAKLLPVWEIEMHSNGGQNTSLAKRE